MKFEICIDVDNVDRAVEFYTRGLGLTVTQSDRDWAILRSGDQTFILVEIPAGPEGAISRDYRRHWTPVHLDFNVDDIDEAVKRAVAAGGKLEGEIRRNPERADLANLSDPAGNGIDLVRRHAK